MLCVVVVGTERIPQANLQNVVVAGVCEDEVWPSDRHCRCN